MVGFRSARIYQWPAILIEGVAQHAYDRLLAQLRFQVQPPDYLSPQSAEMIAMQSQGLASKSMVEQINQECLEDGEHALAWEQIAALNMPALMPVVDVQIIFLEARGRSCWVV